MSEGRRLFASDPGGWTLSFASLMALAYINKLGTIGAALFVAPWLIAVFLRPRAAMEGVIRNAPLLVIPSYAIASILWSGEKLDTLKHSLEFLLTILIAIWASTCVRPRTFISALFLSGLAVMILSVLLGTQDLDEETGEYILVGIFASKNQLALYASILILTALTLMFDAAQSSRMRLLAVAAILPAVWALIVSHSVGSILFCGLGVAAVLVLRMMSLMPTSVRAALFIVGFMLSVAAIIGVTLALGSLDALLNSVGKDASLTGRTDLWESAFNLIEQRPLLGVGFNAFWHIGNPEAERLWFISHVPPGAGFNFHNLYLNTAVELGLVGTACLAVLLCAIGLRLLWAMLYDPQPHHFLAAGIFVYFVALSPLEAYFLYEFHPGTLLLALCWCYSGPLAPAAAASLPRVPRPKPLFAGNR